MSRRLRSAPMSCHFTNTGPVCRPSSRHRPAARPVRGPCSSRRSVFNSCRVATPPPRHHVSRVVSAVPLMSHVITRARCFLSLRVPSPSASALGPTLVRVTALFRPLHPHFEIDSGHVGTPEPLFQGGSEEPLASASTLPCRSASWFEYSLIFRGGCHVSDILSA